MGYVKGFTEGRGYKKRFEGRGWGRQRGAENRISHNFQMHSKRLPLSALACLKDSFHSSEIPKQELYFEILGNIKINLLVYVIIFTAMKSIKRSPGQWVEYAQLNVLRSTQMFV